MEFMTKNLQFYMFLSKSFYKSESPKKLCHKNNIKKITQCIFQFFCQIGDLDFGINPILEYIYCRLTGIPKSGFYCI